MKKLVIMLLLTSVFMLSGCSAVRYGLISTKPFVSNATYVRVNTSKSFSESEYYVFGIRITPPKDYTTVINSALDKEKADFLRNVNTRYYSNGISINGIPIFGLNTYTVTGEIWKTEAAAPIAMTAPAVQISKVEETK